MKQLRLLFISLSIFLTGCNFQTNAPKEIKNYVISFYVAVVGSEDQEYLKKNRVYYFNKNLTYFVKVDGKIAESGNYSYRRLGKNSAQIVTSYTDSPDTGIYTTIIKFTAPQLGTWTSEYYLDGFQKDTGTFTIIKIGSKH